MFVTAAFWVSVVGVFICLLNYYELYVMCLGCNVCCLFVCLFSCCVCECWSVLVCCFSGLCC